MTPGPDGRARAGAWPTGTADEDGGAPMGRGELRVATFLHARQGKGPLGEFHALRYVPGSSPLHRMWAGTKLVALTLLSIALLLWPTWRSLVVGGAVLVVAFLAARLPRGISPKLPKWIFALLGVGFLVALFAGGPPIVHVGRWHFGVGGVEAWARLLLLTFEILGATALLGWTTPLADLSPALGRLIGPLRRVKVPVDELVGAIALSIRCLPLLLEEVRVLRAPLAGHAGRRRPGRCGSSPTRPSR